MDEPILRWPMRVVEVGRIWETGADGREPTDQPGVRMEGEGRRLVGLAVSEQECRLLGQHLFRAVVLELGEGSGPAPRFKEEQERRRVGEYLKEEARKGMQKGHLDDVGAAFVLHLADEVVSGRYGK